MEGTCPSSLTLPRFPMTCSDNGECHLLVTVGEQPAIHLRDAGHISKTCPSSPALAQVPYDLLVVTVGEQPATFGVPGVSQYCHFMKEISDTVAIRNRIGQ